MDNSYHENKNPMYQFPTQHHYPHHIYTQCTTSLDHSKIQNVNLGPEAKFPSFMPQNVVLDEHLHINEPPKNLETPPLDEKDDKKKKNAPRKQRTERSKSGEARKKSDKSVDTSTFTIEERLVAAVWIHERHHTHDTITEIKHKFLRRFSRDPPSKTTLFAWERKLFSTGNVCDAPRPGRPEKRKSHMCEVAASLKSSPALSLRARAAALRLPRTTLHNILKKDLLRDQRHTHNDNAQDKPPPKRRVKQPPRKTHPPPALAPPAPAPVPAPAPPLPPHSHMQYVMHAMHSHPHTQYSSLQP